MVIWRPLKRFLIAAVLSVPVLTFAGLPVPVSKSVDLLTAAGQKFGRVQSSVDDHISSQSDETCGHHYFGSTAPRINNPLLVKSTRILCADAFATVYSGVARSPLWRSEERRVGQGWVVTCSFRGSPVL